ncbi:hypothetical protein [Maribacter sp. Hel_I_7]|uniref:hypothetical protein n=1 Tax=Maribacter sp. Hel_I_7 TaxID=1249997 RepID=UPI000A8971E0|nr:hypothetical protein [Maribacter sp. Hel_I_7]|tara:strand:- start:644 stop:805 length:162 start_codon:yes stop_codon:yes gene_type:complete
MKNLQYARVGNVRPKGSYDQNLNEQQVSSNFSGAFKAQEAANSNNHLNNISCK